MEKEIRYTNGEIMVIWKPEICIHSGNCVNGLSSVFKPMEKPWVDMNGAGTEEIVQQVKKCPSGALSFVQDSSKDEDISQTQVVEIEVRSNGPLLVHGNIRIKNPDGSEFNEDKTTALCRCGASGNKPLCDGSHKKINFSA